jgi:hypothetical protein
VFTRTWAAAAAARALRTLAQTAIALIGTTAVIEGVDWQLVASGAGLAAILSVLTSLGGLPEVAPVPTLEQVADADAAGNDRTAFPYA